MDDRFKEDIQTCQQDFEESGNPVFLFIGYRRCRKNNLPIEEWILSYFDNVAKQILEEIYNRSDGIGPGNRRAESFLYDMMYKGRGDIFNLFLNNLKKLEAIVQYNKLKLTTPNRPDLDIRLQINEEIGVNEKTIEGWIKEYTNEFSQIKKAINESKKKVDKINRSPIEDNVKREYTALFRIWELSYDEPRRPIIDILQQVEEETGVDGTKFNDMLNRWK